MKTTTDRATLDGLPQKNKQTIEERGRDHHMLWIGIIVGFATGVVFITLLYTPLVDKVKMLEHKLLRDKELLDEALKTLHAYQKQNDLLRSDLDVMQRMVPPEVYARWYDN